MATQTLCACIISVLVLFVPSFYQSLTPVLNPGNAVIVRIRNTQILHGGGSVGAKIGRLVQQSGTDIVDANCTDPEGSS
ncbi:hypothetical protein FB567DRAFT_514930 [Paraphoma chrysanthemicola]|uniref:Uncharacterized protein n=1 Tax=Paraphoma chrysanthemicola TaxID=798071 RepID=A0A8K0REV3_9PLEO|nr:hypothetical protein FB567DRAFT_514930 [Paraphoma chrysanthemicola]